MLENANVDSTQRNVVFLVHAEKVHQIGTTAGTSISLFFHIVVMSGMSYFYVFPSGFIQFVLNLHLLGTISRLCRHIGLLYVISRVP